MITQFKLFEDKRHLKKVNFEWINPTGEVFKFKNVSVYNDYAYVPMMGVSQVMRQYIKQRWKVPFQISSSSFSGGDSITVYLSPLKVSENLLKEIEEELTIIFSAGSFDGRDDSYNYKPSNFKISIDDEKYRFNTKYLNVNYEPKYGSKDWDEYHKWKKMNHEAEKYNL